MDRRAFVTGIALGVLAHPFVAWAQREGTAHRIGSNPRRGVCIQDEMR